MNGIQGKKPSGRKCNILFKTVVTVLKHKKSKIDHTIYIKVFYDGTISYLALYTDDVLNNNNNEKSFP